MFRQDVILRAIEEIAAAIAKALGFAGAAQFEEALDAVRDGKSALPIVPGMVDDMAPEALFQLLGKDYSLALVALLDAEAGALAGLKRDVLAERSRHRARALEALARAVAGGSAALWLAVTALSPQGRLCFPRVRLSPWYALVPPPERCGRAAPTPACLPA